MEKSFIKRLVFDKTEFKRLFAIMAPLYIANLLRMAMGLVDTLVAGQAGATDLAGVALGGAVCWPVLIATGAILTILGPIISRLCGEGNFSRVGYVLNNAKLLAAVLMAIALVVLFAASSIFNYITDDPEIAAIAQNYVLFIACSVPASIMMFVVQGNFEGYGQTRPAMLMNFCGLVINIPLNFAFVFGWGFIPAMGGAGCGLATAVINWVLVGGLLSMMFASHQHRLNAKKMWSLRMPDFGQIGRILKLGFPMGVATFCEMTFFCAVTLIIAPLGKIAVSAQQVALNLSGVMFMLPMSLGIAASIRGAFHIGAKNKVAFYRLLSTLLISSVIGVFCTMMLSVALRYQILGAFTSEESIISIAQVLVVLCALYQLPDAMQALMSGLLRACHDTKVITAVNLSSYWLLGFPLAYILVRTDWIVPAMGPAGAWVSFIIALTFAATLMTWRFIHTIRRTFRD